MKAPIYNADGTTTRDITLPETIFSIAWNGDLVHQVVTALAANRRPTVAHTKFRGEVSGGGRKPWRQKGTGNARHGSIRSPIWRGGGTTHGPRAQKSYAKTTNSVQRTKALAAALSRKFADGEVAFLDIELTEPKTKTALSALAALAKAADLAGAPMKPARSVYVVLPEHNEVLFKSFRNIGTVGVGRASDLNAFDVLQYKYIVFISPEAGLAALSARLPAQERTGTPANATA